MELHGGAIDIPATVFALSCAGDCAVPVPGAGDCTAGRPPRVSELGAYARASVATEYASLEDLRGLMAPVKAVAPIFLVLNGVLTLWAWQYYHGVHTLYRSLFERGPDWFKTVAPPDAFLSELSGIELILGAADTCLVNLPVCWMANRLYDSGLGLGLYGHINLSMSIVTYIANMWLFADKSPIMDTCKLGIDETFCTDVCGVSQISDGCAQTDGRMAARPTSARRPLRACLNLACGWCCSRWRGSRWASWRCRRWV